MKASWNVACIFALSLPYYAICTTTYALNYTCSPPASQGGRGYCGPSFCENSASLAKDCIFTSKIIDYQSSISKLASKSCVQSTDARCSSAALRAVIVGGGIKAAYCNDAFLVIVSDGTPGFSTNLESIKNPPGAVSSDGSACVTRTVNPSYHVAKIPLYPTLLSTSDKNINNVNTNSYPAGPGDANGAYMSSTIKNTAATYGLPTRGDDLLCYCCIFRSTGSAELIIFTIAFTAMNKFISSHNLGAIGISVAGQEIFPVFNNLATLAPQKCEVDTCNEVRLISYLSLICYPIYDRTYSIYILSTIFCLCLCLCLHFTNQHVGGGGGQPHLHGDPFGSWCLYSARNYSRSDVHPPQIGWAFDGMSIYGRHLSVDNIGYTIILDDCGGHIHDIYGYHYHAQVITALTDNGAVKGQINGQPYYASTTGPYQCLKGDISKITNYFGGLLVSHTSVLPDTTTSMCSGTTNYYTASGIVLPYSTPSSASPSQAPTLGYSTYLIRQVRIIFYFNV